MKSTLVLDKVSRQLAVLPLDWEESRKVHNVVAARVTAAMLSPTGRAQLTVEVRGAASPEEVAQLSQQAGEEYIISSLEKPGYYVHTKFVVDIVKAS